MRSLPSDFSESSNSSRSQWSWTWYVVVPVLINVVVLCIGYVGGELKYHLMDSHVSVEETVTGALVIASAVLAFMALRQPAARNQPLLKIWLAAFIVAMVYFAGEDLNWGQHYIGWTPPDYFLEHNREHETNIHNMSPLLFNRVPRTLVRVWLIVACILVPLGWSWPKRALKDIVPTVLWPDRRIVLAAVLTLLWRIVPGVWSGASNSADPLRFSEVEELMLAYCLVLYGQMILSRLRQPASS